DPRVFDRRKIDHQTVVTNSQPTRIVAAAANRNKQIVVSREVYGTNHIGHVYAPRDQARLFVDHSIVNLSSFIVILIAWFDQAPTQVSFEIDDRVFVEHGEVSLKRSPGQHVE